MLIQKFQTDIFHNYSSSLIEPTLIQLTPNLIIAVFELMKLIPAKYTIMKAHAEGKIDPTCPIVETSSGTYALGLGIVCSELGLPFFIISDPIIDQQLEQRLLELGGKVQIVTSTVDNLDVQSLRLDALHEHLKKNEFSFWPKQYDNVDNRMAYNSFADYLLKNVGKNFTLVGPVGSGGSTCGTIERLRGLGANVKLVGVDTFGSVLFGLAKGKRQLRGLGNSILPKNLIHEYFDEVHWINADYAYSATRQLNAKKSIFCGPTTGASFCVAKHLAEQNQDQMVVFIAPDSGHRYASTVYNNEWIIENNIILSQINQLHPKKITDLNQAIQPWSYINWEKRSYNER